MKALIYALKAHVWGELIRGLVESSYRYIESYITLYCNYCIVGSKASSNTLRSFSGQTLGSCDILTVDVLCLNIFKTIALAVYPLGVTKHCENFQQYSYQLLWITQIDAYCSVNFWHCLWSAYSYIV